MGRRERPERDDFREALKTHGGMQFGQPPSPCYPECRVMRTQVPKEHRNPELSARLDAFRTAVMFIAESEMKKPGAIAEMQLSTAAPDAELPAFLEGVDRDSRDQAFHCAGEVAQGRCRVLDIVARDINGVAGYTTNDTTASLFESVRPKTTDQLPGDYISPANIARFTVDAEGKVEVELVEKPPRPSKSQVNDDIKTILRRAGF